jgi:hypothetical protein
MDYPEKLLSCEDFVLWLDGQKTQESYQKASDGIGGAMSAMASMTIGMSLKLKRIRDYATLLKSKPDLNRLVPCDSNGVILPTPIESYKLSDDMKYGEGKCAYCGHVGSMINMDHICIVDTYKDADDKVWFVSDHYIDHIESFDVYGDLVGELVRKSFWVDLLRDEFEGMY